MKHIILLLLFSVLCLGCSQNVHVSGTVTYEDGSPVTFGAVKFETEFYRFSGGIRSDGTYDAGAAMDGKGIPPDVYKVWLAQTARLEGAVNSQGQVSEDDIVMFPQITDEFTSPVKTPLSLEVKHGSGRIIYDISVKRHPDWNKQQEYQQKEGAGAVKKKKHD